MSGKTKFNAGTLAQDIIRDLQPPCNICADRYIPRSDLILPI